MLFCSVITLLVRTLAAQANSRASASALFSATSTLPKFVYLDLQHSKQLAHSFKKQGGYTPKAEPPPNQNFMLTPNQVAPSIARNKPAPTDWGTRWHLGCDDGHMRKCQRPAGTQDATSWAWSPGIAPQCLYGAVVISKSRQEAVAGRSKPRHCNIAPSF